MLLPFTQSIDSVINMSSVPPTNQSSAHVPETHTTVEEPTKNAENSGDQVLLEQIQCCQDLRQAELGLSCIARELEDSFFLQQGTSRHCELLP